MHYLFKQKAIYLRTKEQLSFSAILQRIPVAKSTLSRWLQCFPLSKERVIELRKLAWKKRETKIELFRIAMQEKREQKNRQIYQKYLQNFKNLSLDSFFIAGLVLYQAEGLKTSNNRLSLSNTDPRLIKFFINWLKNYFGTTPNRMKAYLQLYPNMSIEQELKFWMKKLNLPRKQFYKPFIRRLTPSSFSCQESWRHGTCSLMVNDTHVVTHVKMAREAYFDTILKKGT